MGDHARGAGGVHRDIDPLSSVRDTAVEEAYLAGLADAKGLAKMGENSGADDVTKMTQAVGYAKQYGLKTLLWIRASDAYCSCSGYATIDDLSRLTS